MILIVFATEREAAPFLESVSSRIIENEACTMYGMRLPSSEEEAAVLICGMGRIPAKTTLEQVCSKFDITRVLNVGICGALQSDLNPGELYRVDWVGDGDESVDSPAMIAGHNSRSWNHLQTRSLLTVTHPVMDVSRRGDLSERGALVDMEGFAIAEVCQRLKISCELLKGVSDNADDSGKSDILKNIDEVSAALATLLNQGLQEEGES